MARDPTDGVTGDRRRQCLKGMCQVPQPLSQREWRAGDIRQGEEDGATSQEAELERAANGEKHGLNLWSRTAPLCRTGYPVIPEEGLTQSRRHSLPVISKRAAA